MLETLMTIAIPSHLSDGALIAEVTRCARDERHATAQLIAHLAELDARRLYLGAGHSSLFTYCRDALGLSDDAAYNRVEAARASRLFPGVLEQLVDGSLTVTSVRLLARHLTAENHRELLAVASRRSKREVEELIARRFPKPDTPSSVRKVPERTPSRLTVAPAEPAPAVSAPATPMVAPAPVLISPETVRPSPAAPTHRPAVKPLAADRYEIRFTASAATRDKLKVTQDLLRHAIPSGDVAAIFDRALSELIEAHSRRKMAVVRKPGKVRVVRPRHRSARDTSRPRSSASCGSGTGAAARSSARAGADAASVRSSNTTTSSPTRPAVKRRSPTSSSGVARTTATRQTCSSERVAGTVGPAGWPNAQEAPLFPGVSCPFRNGRKGSALHARAQRRAEQPGDRLWLLHDLPGIHSSPRGPTGRAAARTGCG